MNGLFSRRLILAVVFVALPGLASAQTGGSPPMPAVFCEGTYALCIKALCSPVPTAAHTIGSAACSCDVVQGWSMGPGSCTDRQPVQSGGRTYLVSTYSNLYNRTEQTLQCKETLWAWCYGAPCIVDEKDPKRAVCTCPVKTSAMNTLGGKCRQQSCNVIWSAATPANDAFANQHYFEYMKANHPDVPVYPPAKVCGAIVQGKP